MSGSTRRLETSYGDPLTKRELEIVVLLCKGFPLVEAAAHATMSVHTAKDHVKAVKRKLGVTTKLEVAYWAGKNGIEA